jgi:iron complex transport system ATP-binding protein
MSEALLSVQNLSVAYGSQTVLREVSFDLPPGSILGLIGPNGAGKSSLIRALSGVQPLQSGQVQVRGRNLLALNPLERARQMAVVPQARQLPPAFTAWELVLLGRTPHLNWLGQTSARDEELARQAMERTDTLQLAGRRIGELSGGEQQRLLLARALAQSAPVLLLDEPTTHLDLHHQLALLDQVRDVVHSEPAGCSALVVLHDLNLVLRYADRVLLLVDGRVRAAGEPAEVLEPGLLSEVYRVPLQVVRPARGGYPVIVPTIR